MSAKCFMAFENLRQKKIFTKKNAHFNRQFDIHFVTQIQTMQGTDV
jgi:hypothetical protein